MLTPALCFLSPISIASSTIVVTYGPATRQPTSPAVGINDEADVGHTGRAPTHSCSP